MELHRSANAAVSMDDSMACELNDLVSAIANNDFDIVGLADFPDQEEELLVEALQTLWDIIRKPISPSLLGEQSLALLLFGMTRVAQEHYGTDGDHEYWKPLFERIKDAVWDSKNWSRIGELNTQQHQELLGRCYRAALARFGYEYPTDGHLHLAPILFHSGVPRISLDGLLDAVAIGVDRYHADAVLLPPGLRAQLANRQNCHRNLQRLLDSDLLAAEQVWATLSSVVLAASNGEDFEPALQLLPQVIDTDRVRERLSSVSSTLRKRTRTQSVPRVRFCSDTGDVRVFVPSDIEFRLIDAEGIELASCLWQQTPCGRSAVSTEPLPNEFTIRCESDAAPSLPVRSRPESWPGIWFRATNGALEDGRRIDANGLRPGRWITVVDGCPDRWSVVNAVRVPLAWSHWPGGRHWTAWELTVPSFDRQHPEVWCEIEGQRRSLRISRRGGASIERMTEPAATARTRDGIEVDVFPAAPSYQLTRGNSLQAVLSRYDDAALTVIDRLELSAEEPWRAPQLDPGVYEIREARGAVRPLAHFAILPSVEIGELSYEDGGDVASVSCVADAGLGAFAAAIETQETDEGVFHCKTIEPNLDVTWNWKTGHARNALRLTWPLAGLRWRVLGLGAKQAQWTRDTIFLKPKEVCDNDAIMEVQAPHGSVLRIQDRLIQPPTDGRSAYWSPAPLKLQGHTGGGRGQVEVAVDSESSLLAAFITNRPLVSALSGEISEGVGVVQWKGDVSAKDVALLVWSPLDPSVDPIRVLLSESDALQQEVYFELEQLPRRSSYAASICQVLPRRGFGGDSSVLLAAKPECPDDPVAFWIDADHSAEEGDLDECQAISDWFLQATTLMHDGGIKGDECRERLFGTQSLTDPLGAAMAFLRRSDFPLRADRHYGTVLALAWETIGEAFERDPLRLVEQSANPKLASQATLAAIRKDVGVGASAPSRWLAHYEDLSEWSTVYPFELIRDLYLVSRSDEIGLTPEDGQGAARRIRHSLHDAGLGRLIRLLPLFQPICCGSRGSKPWHKFEMNRSLDADIADDDAWVELLGQDDLSIKAFAAPGDKFWELSHSTQKGVWLAPDVRARRRREGQSDTPEYDLYWASDQRCWQVDRHWAGEPRYQNYLRDPLVATLPVVDSLVEDCGVRSALRHCVSDGDAEVLSEWADNIWKLGNCMTEQAASRSLHRELLDQSDFVEVEVLGGSTRRRNEKTLPKPVQMAWILAWAERSRAGQRNDLPADAIDLSFDASNRFSACLADACESWPGLMRRSLMLAELLLWTFLRKGIGVAATFDRTLADQE